ncbi:DUF413 domain-containing protein [Vibrio salinus]|uniref:DUF413 domain-containing protein n=1 Tax=Vibrio salinus TaxID=2899784 RepID=UPI001E513531|nr:DUF413 domain-containing protein [Vibrio salinus]MCE0495417.1 DUF413 domain-containing protein [Vibrio salinus]
MDHICLRMGKNHFEDRENFPDGFVESGFFSDMEEDILIYWGETMYRLEIGDIYPENEEEEHFVRMLDKPEIANSILERTWLKYRRHINYFLESGH